MDNLELESVRIDEEDRVVAWRILRVLRRRIENSRPNPFEDLIEPIDIGTTRGAKCDVVQTGRVSIVFDAVPTSLRGLEGD